jgi:hypothetical protein
MTEWKEIDTSKSKYKEYCQSPYALFARHFAPTGKHWPVIGISIHKGDLPFLKGDPDGGYQISCNMKLRPSAWWEKCNIPTPLVRVAMEMLRKCSPIYQLTRLDLSELGGPMHSQGSIKESWTKPFNTLEAAQAFATKDYKEVYQGPLMLLWQSDGTDWRTQDLLFCQYQITLG